MTDTWGDGWNGNVLALTQGNTHAATFGQTFTDGDSDVASVVIPKAHTTITVFTQGSWNQEVGFEIINVDGSVLFSHPSGTDFISTHIFGTIFSGITCGDDGDDGDDDGDDGGDDPTKVDYQIYLSDYWGDGWNGGTMRLSQGNKYWIVGAQFTDGYDDGPYSITLDIGVEV